MVQAESLEADKYYIQLVGVNALFNSEESAVKTSLHDKNFNLSVSSFLQLYFIFISYNYFFVISIDIYYHEVCYYPFYYLVYMIKILY